MLTYSNLDIEKERLKALINISKEFNVKLNLIYHTTWDYTSWCKSGAIDRMKELLEVIQNSRVNILIENMIEKVHLFRIDLIVKKLKVKGIF